MEQEELTTGYIFDIQGFSVHDGPGCRTLIFFKGCSLECAWCSNPEGISFYPEPLYRNSKCTLDEHCINACKHGAISIAKNETCDHLNFRRDICAKCNTYDCASACCSDALKIGGYKVSVDDLYNRIHRDRQYWGEGGGITLTGGEPFAQPEFAFNFLKHCYEAYIHTAVETCGNVAWSHYKKALPYIDWIFFDLKTLDESRGDLLTYSRSPSARPHDLLSASPPDRLSGYTPISNILENARRIAQEFPGRLIFRLPVIPGFNDDAENINNTASFIRSTGRKEVNLLPLHHLGREKYNLLDKQYYTNNFNIPANGNLENIAQQFKSLGITCYIGSETPF